MKNNKKEYYFIDLNQKVKIGDIIHINNIQIPLTNDIINNNPHKFYSIDDSINNNFNMILNNDFKYIYEYFKYWENTINDNPPIKKSVSLNKNLNLKFKDTQYVKCISISSELKKSFNIYSNSCYLTKYLVDNNIVNNNDYLLNENNFKFKKISENDYLDWLYNIFILNYPNINWSKIYFDNNDFKLKICDINEKRNIIVYDANINYWYKLYENENNEIFSENDKIYLIDKNNINKYNHFDDVQYSQIKSLPNNINELINHMYVTTNKNIARDKYYNMKRIYYENKLSTHNNHSPYYTFITMLKYIAKDLNGNWKYKYGNKSYIIYNDFIAVSYYPSITDIPFKNKESAKEAFEIIKPYYKISIL